MVATEITQWFSCCSISIKTQSTYKGRYLQICFELYCNVFPQLYVELGVFYWRTAAREKLHIITDHSRMHATYIILQLKSLVSVLVHLCHVLLEVGNWYRHPDLWHWKRHVIIKLSPLHAEELYTFCSGVIPVLVFLIGFSVCRCSQFQLNAFTTGDIHCAPCAFVVRFDIWLWVDTARRWYLAWSSYPVQQCRIQSYKE